MNTLSQTVQHVSNSLQNTIGSVSIAIVLAFYNLHLNLKDSDEACQEFATFYLEHLHFLYENSDGNGSEVSTLFYLTDEVYA